MESDPLASLLFVLLMPMQRPYKLSTSLLHTLLIREKVPNGATQYYLYLGEPEQDQHEKFLMAASHHSR